MEDFDAHIPHRVLLQKKKNFEENVLNDYEVFMVNKCDFHESFHDIVKVHNSERKYICKNTRNPKSHSKLIDIFSHSKYKMLEKN